MILLSPGHPDKRIYFIRRYVRIKLEWVNDLSMFFADFRRAKKQPLQPYGRSIYKYIDKPLKFMYNIFVAGTPHRKGDLFCTYILLLYLLWQM